MKLLLLFGCVAYSMQCEHSQNYMTTAYYDKDELPIRIAPSNNLEVRLQDLQNQIDEYKIDRKSAINTSNTIHFDRLPLGNFESLEKHNCTSLATEKLRIVLFYIGHCNSTMDRWNDLSQFVRISCAVTTTDSICTAAFNKPKSMIYLYIFVFTLTIMFVVFI